MQSFQYPFGQFSNCIANCLFDQFPSRVYRFARALHFLLRRFYLKQDESNDFTVAEDGSLVWLGSHYRALARVTALGCSTVDSLLEEAERTRGWSYKGVPLLTGVAVQLEQIVNPNVEYARNILLQSIEIMETRLKESNLDVAVYDSRDCGRLSDTALRNSSLMAALGTPIVRYNLGSLRRSVNLEPSASESTQEYIQTVTEQRERSVHLATWMLASGNFHALSVKNVRRMFIDIALSSPDEAPAWELFDLALHGSRSALIAFAERVAGPLEEPALSR